MKLMSVSKGFTLIEVMLVSVVMGAMITAGMSSMRRFEERQRTVQAADSFVTELRGVQKMADAGERPSGCLGELQGYRVETSFGGSEATVKARCSTDIEVKTISLRGGAQFYDNVGILFRPLGRGAVLDGGSDTIDLNVTGLANSYTVPIAISSGGIVSSGNVIAQAIPTPTPGAAPTMTPHPTTAAISPTSIFPSPTGTSESSLETPTLMNLSSSCPYPGSGYGQNNLYWQMIDGATSYRIQWQCNYSPYESYQYITVDQHYYTHAELSMNGTNQCSYQVAAIGDAGESQYSTVLSDQALSCL